MKFLSFVLLISVFLFIPGSLFAASSKDVAEVVSMVSDKSIPVLLRKQEFVGKQYEGTTIVFVYEGMRYTIYDSGERTSPSNPGSAWLSMWVRKDGSTGQGQIKTFSDNAFDGVVDFGIGGDKNRRIFSSGSSLEQQGLKYKSYWQTEYDNAIKAALAYKKHVQS